MGTSLRDVFSEERIALDLQATNQADAFREVAARLQSHSCVLDFEAFYREVLARESISSTVMDGGLAFPHARTDCVSKIIGAAGRSREGVTCEDGRRVHLIFLLGTPKAMVCDYLKCLASLAKNLRDEKLREALMNTESEQKFLQLLAGELAAAES